MLNDFHSKRPDAYWKQWKSLNHKEVNNSTLALNNFGNYSKDQVQPSPTAYFDKIHMEEITQFVDSFNAASEEIHTSAN